MANRIIFNKEFIVARFICYTVFGILVFIMLFFDPFTYICNQNGYRCIGCGMKTGIYYLTKMQLERAMQESKLMPYFLATVALVILDIVISIFHTIKDGGV